jgi:hypothetical protein
MPDVQEVFRMATQKVRPDPGFVERQHGQQRRRTIRRKVGVYGLVAALVVVVAVVAVQLADESAEHVPLGQPSTTATPAAAPAGTVMFNGSTCSMLITADRIEPGLVVLELVNDSDRRAMFDSWQLAKGYSFPAFERAIERDRRLAQAGKLGHAFPSEKDVTNLSSDVIRAHSSETIVSTMLSGRHAIVCLRLWRGAPAQSRFRPSDVVGPIIVR